jgi:cobalt-zinc-cadmium resistance protein CzcA
MNQIRQIVLANRSGVPVRISDVANVGVGKELRTGSASENQHEVVVGTALMLIGANSRTVSEAVSQKMEQVNKSLPPDIEAKTVLNRTALVDRTLETVEHNLFEGALLVVVILFLMLGNIRAAFITALVIPMSMLITMTGMVQSKMTGNLMSLGALDFGLIVDGAVVVVENTLRLLAEKQYHLGRKLRLHERLETVFRASKQVLSVTLFGQAIIITVYLPILTLTGVEGKMFQPMAMTVIFALVAAFVLSLTLIPALVSIFMTGKVTEKENFLVRSALWAYRPIVRWAVKLRYI